MLSPTLYNQAGKKYNSSVRSSPPKGMNRMSTHSPVVYAFCETQSLAVPISDEQALSLTAMVGALERSSTDQERAAVLAGYANPAHNDAVVVTVATFLNDYSNTPSGLRHVEDDAYWLVDHLAPNFDPGILLPAGAR